MPLKTHHSTVICFVFLLSACATPASVNMLYSKPQSHPIENKVVVDSSFDETWDTLVGSLATTYYIINNIDKQSRLINVSYSEQNNPSIYIDCGITDRDFTIAGKSKNYIYKTADSSEYSYSNGRTEGNNAYYVNAFRTTSLEGRANIYVAPKGEGETLVTVNVKYIWDVSTQSQQMTYQALYGEHYTLNITSPIQRGNPTSFNTGSKGGVDGGVECVSTGKFEGDIIDILRE